MENKNKDAKKNINEEENPKSKIQNESYMSNVKESGRKADFDVVDEHGKDQILDQKTKHRPRDNA